MSSALANNTYTVQPAGCTSTLIIPDITKTEYSICFFKHCFGENNDKQTITRNIGRHCCWKSTTSIIQCSGCNLLYSQLVSQVALISKINWRRQIVNTVYNNYHNRVLFQQSITSKAQQPPLLSIPSIIPHTTKSHFYSGVALLYVTFLPSHAANSTPQSKLLSLLS